MGALQPHLHDGVAAPASLKAPEQGPPRVELAIAGIPAPKGSRIPGRRKDGTIFTRPASKREHPWVEQVAYAARANRPAGGTLEPPYVVALDFRLPEPKRPTYAYPALPDVDKLARACLDGLVVGELLVDDRHVVELRCSKRFGVPGVAVSVF